MLLRMAVGAEKSASVLAVANSTPPPAVRAFLFLVAVPLCVEAKAVAIGGERCRDNGAMLTGQRESRESEPRMGGRHFESLCRSGLTSAIALSDGRLQRS